MDFCFFIQSAPLCLWTGAFNALTFKVITDRYVFIAILNLVFQLIVCFSFVPLFFWLDDFLLFYACVLFFLVFVNVMFGFDLWLPCFLSTLSPSYICLLQPDSHIIKIIKGYIFLFFSFLFLIGWFPFILCLNTFQFL